MYVIAVVVIAPHVVYFVNLRDVLINLEILNLEQDESRNGLVSIGILSISTITLMRTCCSTQSSDVRSVSNFSFIVSHNKISSH